MLFPNVLFLGTSSFCSFVQLLISFAFSLLPPLSFYSAKCLRKKVASSQSSLQTWSAAYDLENSVAEPDFMTFNKFFFCIGFSITTDKLLETEVSSL